MKPHVFAKFIHARADGYEILERYPKSPIKEYRQWFSFQGEWPDKNDGFIEFKIKLEDE